MQRDALKEQLYRRRRRQGCQPRTAAAHENVGKPPDEGSGRVCVVDHIPDAQIFPDAQSFRGPAHDLGIDSLI
jgi:hypothetical protein